MRKHINRSKAKAMSKARPYWWDLDPYHSMTRDEFEREQWNGEQVKPHWPEWFEELDESEIPF